MQKTPDITPAFIIGTLLESLSALLFILVFIDFQLGSFRIRDFSPPALYTIAAIGFAIGTGLVIKDVLQKIEFLKAQHKRNAPPAQKD